MRSGGPKLICSPYFSIGAVIVLLIMVVKYYSLSSEHDNLLLKVNVIQNQMKLTASNMRNLDTSLSRKEEAYSECSNEKNNLEEKIKKLQADIAERDKSIEQLQSLNTEATQLVKQLQDSNDKLNQDNTTMMEDMKYLRRRNEELTHNEEECRANEGKINQLQGELNTLREQAKELHLQRQQYEANMSKLKQMPDGELPDVDPNAVHIIQPALNGAYGHNAPILPKGDPRAERPEPRLHLDFPLKTDEEVRKDIIAEEEAKVEQEIKDLPSQETDPVQQKLHMDRDMRDDDVHDFANAVLPPKDDHVDFYRKKAKYGIKAVTETLLDLSRLNRNNNLLNDNDLAIGISDEHKAVLKQPLDLNAIHRINEEAKNELEEPPVYDDQELPGPQDKRDPAVLLKDPRAMDQDNDSRIAEAVENGFARQNKGRWRSHNP